MRKLFLAIVAAALLSSCSNIKSNEQMFQEQSSAADIVCFIGMINNAQSMTYYLKDVSTWSFKDGLWRIKYKAGGTFITSLPCVVNHAAEEESDIGR